MANPMFLSADRVSEYLRSEGIHVESERLVELANADLIPHVRLEDGPPMFRKAEAKKWILSNLVRECPGRPVAASFSVFDPVTWNGHVAGVPMELEPMVDSLREFPVGMLRPTACVYFLIKKGRIVYVGKSDNLTGRIMDHLKDKAFNRVLFLRVHCDEASTIEAVFIRLFKPIYNAPCTHDLLTDEIAAAVVNRLTTDPAEDGGNAAHAHIVEKQARRIGALANSFNVAESENAELRARVDEVRMILAAVVSRWGDGLVCNLDSPEDRGLRASANLQVNRR